MLLLFEFHVGSDGAKLHIQVAANHIGEQFSSAESIARIIIREVQGGIGKQRGRKGYCRVVMGKAFRRGTGR